MPDCGVDGGAVASKLDLVEDELVTQQPDFGTFPEYSVPFTNQA